MAEYPYVLTYSKTARPFDELRERGKPPKVNRLWLEGAGFKSKNDRQFGPLLKYLGVIDGASTPTGEYDRLMLPAWRSELASLVRAAYPTIFAALPNAHERSREQLIDLFRAEAPAASGNVIGLMVSTFQSLVAAADFTGKGALVPAPPASTQGDEEPALAPAAPAAPPPTDRGGSAAGPVTMNINISLEIPATEKAEVYDNLFKSMAEHLAVDPTNVVYRREAGATPPMPPCGRRAL